MKNKKIKAIYAYPVLLIIGIFSIVFLYIKILNVNTELQAIQNDADYLRVKQNENTVVPKLKSVSLGNNGLTQIRGFAPAVWISDGQMSAEIFKNGELLKKIICSAEGTWTNKGSVPFLCETSADVKGNDVKIKLTKNVVIGEKGAVKQVMIQLR